MTQFAQIPFSSIVGMSPKVDAMVLDLHALTYTAGVNDITPAGLAQMLLLHPLHVVAVETKPQKKNKTTPEAIEAQPLTYQVVAGFRLFELVSAYHALQHNQAFAKDELNLIPALIHPNAKTASQLARHDLAGSPLVYSLSNKVVEQLTLIKKVLDVDILEPFPKYKSVRTMRNDKKDNHVSDHDD